MLQLQTVPRISILTGICMGSIIESNSCCMAGTGFEVNRLAKLLFSIAGIYSIYFGISFLAEAVIKHAYPHDTTGEHQQFEYPEALLMSTSLFAYLFACVYNHFTYPPAQRKCIPWRRGIKCGLAVCTSNLAYNHAIVLTNFPVVMMVRSCGILSVVLVGVLFTGVKDTRLKLGSRKIFIAAVASLGMIIFKVFDPNSKPNNHHTEMLGLLLLLLSLLADGFLPDFQAVIKSEHRPYPSVLMGEVNKWACFFTISFSIVSGNFVNMVYFIGDHSKLLYDLLMIAVLATAGQMFIYRIVREFRQHMVPFIITTRKIFTVAISIITYGHQISSMQLVGLALVLGISTYEFFSESQRPAVSLPPKTDEELAKEKQK